MTRFRAMVALTLLIVGLLFLAEEAAGLRAVYFSDVLFGEPASRSTSNVSGDALMSDAPVRLDMPFSVEWSGYLHIQSPGRYVFSVRANGPAAILINGRKVVGDLNVGVGVGNPGDIELDAGVHSVVVRYVHAGGRPAIAISMAKNDEPLRPVPVLELSPFRRAPILYECASLIRFAAIAALVLWATAFGFWLVSNVPAAVGGVVASVTALFIAGVVYDVPSWLRGPAPYPYQWQWAYQEPMTTRGVGAAIIAAASLLGILAYLSLGRAPRSPRTRAVLGLAGATVAAAAFQIALLGTAPDGAAAVLTDHTLSVDFNTYFDVAANTTTGSAEFLRSFSTKLSSFDRHAATHPPGPILYYRAVIVAVQRMPAAGRHVLAALEGLGVKLSRLSENSLEPPLLLAAAFIGGLGVALSVALTVWPVATIAEAAGADPLTAAQTGALWGLCPSALLFSTEFDQVVTFLVASCCAFGCLSVTSPNRFKSTASAVGAGALAGLAVFCSFGAIPMLGAAAAAALVVALGRGRSWQRIGRVALLAAAGFLVVSAVPMLVGYDPLGTARIALSFHRGAYTLPRGRGLWMRFNLLDFAIFLGLPLIALCLTDLLSRGAHRAPEDPIRRRLLWAVLASVILLDLADVTRGEVGRLWMPLMPLAFPALLALKAPGSSRALAERVLVGTALALVCISLRLYWNPG